MGYNLLNRYIYKQRKKFNLNLPWIEDPDRSEAIHDLRVSLKKTRGLFLFLDYLTERKISSKQEFKPYRSIFKKVGLIRDLQVHQILLEKYQSTLNIDLSCFISYIRKKEQRERKKLNKWLPGFKLPNWNKSGDKVRDVYHNYKKKKIVEMARTYVRKKIKNVYPLLEKNDDVSLHEARKKLKEARFVIDIILDEKKNYLEKEFQELQRSVKSIEDILGDWHDRVRLLEMLRLFNNDEPEHESGKENRKLLQTVKKELEDLRRKAIESYQKI